MDINKLNELKNKVYKTACDSVFHDKELSSEHFLMLVITELSEAVEAHRNGKFVHNEDQITYELCQKEKFYKYAYENYIKGTIEEELADTVIRLLDLAGLRNIEIYIDGISVPNISKNRSFTQNCYNIVMELSSDEFILPTSINFAIREVLELSSFYNIDLFWHIEQKMKYNELRPKMHGKKY